MTNPEELLDFAVAVAVRLQSCGAETYRVEETVVRIIEAYGIDKSDVFVIPGSIFAGLEDENGQVYSKIRRVKDIDTVLDGVEMYSAFCRRICAETPPVRQARQLLRETEKSIRKYKLPIAYLGYFLIAAGFAVFFGGTLRDALGSGLCGIAVGLCIQGMGFLHANPFFKTFVGGFVLAFAAYSLTVLGLCDNADVVSIGAIMILVPGFLFTNSLRDIIYGDTLSGINRLVQVVIIAIALVVGTSAAFGLSRQIFGTIAGSPQLVEHSLAVQCIAGMVGTLGFGLYLNMHGSGIPYCLVGSIISWVVCCLCDACRHRRSNKLSYCCRRFFRICRNHGAYPQIPGDSLSHGSTCAFDSRCRTVLHDGFYFQKPNERGVGQSDRQPPQLQAQSPWACCLFQPRSACGACIKRKELRQSAARKPTANNLQFRFPFKNAEKYKPSDF